MREKTEMKSESFTVQSACVLECRVATNCPKGGDSGHGGRTVIEFTDGGCADLGLSFDDDRMQYGEVESVNCVRIRLGGDAEAYAMARLLRFAANKLEEMLEANEREQNASDEPDAFAPTN